MAHVLLVVANDDAMLELVHLVMGFNGYTVLAARTASEAEAICAHRAVQLVVADERMPRVEGRDIFQQVKRIRGLEQVPLMLVHGIGVDRSGRASLHRLRPIPLRTFVMEVSSFFAPGRRKALPPRPHAMRQVPRHAARPAV